MFWSYLCQTRMDSSYGVLKCMIQVLRETQLSAENCVLIDFNIKNDINSIKSDVRQKLFGCALPVSKPHQSHYITYRLCIRACVRVGSLASVPWPEHTEVYCTSVRTEDTPAKQSRL